MRASRLFLSALETPLISGRARFIACTGNPRKMPKRVVNNHGRDALDLSLADDRIYLENDQNY